MTKLAQEVLAPEPLELPPELALILLMALLTGEHGNVRVYPINPDYREHV